MGDIALLPAATVAIHRIRREARAALTDLTLSPSRHEIAWFVLRGARNPKCRRNQPNHGAAIPSPEWPMSATVFESGAESWASNDLDSIGDPADFDDPPLGAA